MKKIFLFVLVLIICSETFAQLTITTHPAATKTVNEGAAFTPINVAASGGTGTYTYQWYKNGIPITDVPSSQNTASFSFNNPGPSLSDSGAIFTCKVSDGSNTVTSNGCKLTVNPATAAPIIGSSQQPANKEFAIGEGPSGSYDYLALVTLGNVSAIFSTIKWYKKVGDTDSVEVANTRGGTALTGNLKNIWVSSATEDKAGEYWCVISNSMGSAVSNHAIITVVNKTAPPEITLQPKSQSLLESIGTESKISLSIAAKGAAPIRYKWVKNGTDSIGNTAEIGITPVRLSDAGVYQCFVSNNNGTTASAEAYVTVTTRNAVPVINTQPQNQSLAENNKLTLSISATSPDGLDVNYQWMRNGTAVSQNASARTATLVIDNATYDNAGTYWCVLSCGNSKTVTSESAIVVVNPTPPVISIQPQDQMLLAGSPLTLFVEATGSALTYQWKKDGVDIAGATKDTFSIPAVSAANAGKYFCMVTNPGGGIASQFATISISASDVAPSITAQPVNQVAALNGSLMFKVTATGTNLKYIWSKNGVDLPNDTSAIFKRSSLVLADTGHYSCKVYNSVGTVYSTSVTFTLVETPQITTQPVSTAVLAGGSINLSVQAKGGALKYQWKKNGVDISGATSAIYTKGGVTTADAGSYTCEVSNIAGKVNSTAANITVSNSTALPEISKNPVGQSVAVGGEFMLLMEAIGDNLTYQWQKGGVNISGATEEFYLKSNITAADTGYYACIVTNLNGKVSTLLAHISLVDTPKIVTQPLANIEIEEGEALTLSVVAEGVNMTYQWQKDGVAIDSATQATLLIKDVTASTAGSYVCIITNSAGVMVSDTTVVTITAAEEIPITIFKNLEDEYVQASAKVQLRAKGIGSELIVRWYIDGKEVTVSDDGKFYMGLDISKGKHKVRGESSDGKFVMEKIVTIK